VIDDRLDSELAHSSHGPSGAEGWSTCLDYVNANRGLPDDPTEVAAEGTVAHGISDDCLRYGFDALDFVGQRTRLHDWTFTWTVDDALLLQPGIDRVRGMGGRFFSEHRVDVSHWVLPGQFGTLDRAVIVKIDGVWIVYVSDLKWGRGVAISPVQNKQVMLYLLGFWQTIAQQIVGTDPVRFIIEIDQPRCPGGGGVWHTTLDDLLAFGDWIRERAELTLQPNPPRVASEKGCIWCRRKRAAGGCREFEDFNLALLGTDYSELDLEIMIDNPIVPAGAMTPERRSYILQHRSMLEHWLDQLANEELRDALAGRPTPGRKCVVDTRKGSRDTYEDEAAAEAVLVPILGDRSFTKKLISPAQARKQISSDDYEKLSEHIKFGQHGHSMVPETDARLAVKPVEITMDEE